MLEPQKNIRLIRLQKNMMQITLAKMVGISKNHLSNIEHQKVSASLRLINKIYKALDLELEIKVKNSYKKLATK